MFQTFALNTYYTLFRAVANIYRLKKDRQLHAKNPEIFKNFDSANRVYFFSKNSAGYIEFFEIAAEILLPKIQFFIAQIRKKPTE